MFRMKATRTSFQTYLRTGIDFIREHPQIWFTALLALFIACAFVYVSLRFASVASEAQEQLYNDRAGWLLDAVVALSPTMRYDTSAVRNIMTEVTAKNETIVTFSMMLPHGDSMWLRQVASGGVEEGVSVPFDPLLQFVAVSAMGDPHNAYRATRVVDGERRFVTMRAVTDEEGASMGVLYVELKLTEADRRMATELRVSWAVLAGVLIIILILFFRHARIVDFATLYKKQIEIDQMKDSFLSMASHELKSPLSVIRGYIEYLEDDDLEKSQRKEFLRRIALSADELRQLVDDILDVSRIEMGRLRFSPDSVKPAEVVSEVLEMFRMTASQKGIGLVYTPNETDGARVIRVDRGRLKQVTVNLISNALKYTLQGTVTVTTIQVGDAFELAVRDTGVGMSAEEQQKLFGKFYRVEAEETKGVRGTGLGLWITKYLIEHMSGTISVESIKGEGSRFVVRFPIDTPAVSE